MKSEEPELKNTQQAFLKALGRDKVLGKFFRKGETANATSLEVIILHSLAR